MIHSQSSRRNFLGSLAILSAGTAFGAVTRLVTETPALDLQKEWKQFCRKNGGELYSLALPAANSLSPCQGHWHQTGEAIAFPRHNLLAQPTWVFWSETKSKPADVIITLYKNNADKTKLYRLNRFEWEALLSLPVGKEAQDVIALMKETCKPAAKAENNHTSAALKVAVRKGRHVSITANLLQQPITINKQFLYSI